jgi:hypothetical protein
MTQFTISVYLSGRLNVSSVHRSLKLNDGVTPGVTSARTLLSADDGSNDGTLIVNRADEEAEIPIHMLPKKKMRSQLVL